METVREILATAFSLNSIWWLVIKAGIWFGVAFIIIIKTDAPDPEASLKNLKSTLGFFLMFILLSGGLIYLLFGQVAS